ncbi:hypothetical protein HYU95_06085 [Candidatus Daviesbacteria bacterium]|nr:hypothetical protein [Candidatus Daviesbacteria bacterium]
MNEPAPKGVIHLVDEDAPKMRIEVAKHVGQITGQSVPPQSLHPIDEPLQEKITEELGNAKRYTGAHFEEAFHGKSEAGTVNIVSKGGKLPISIAAVKALKRRLLGQQAA